MTSGLANGPDPVVLRLPRGGGVLRATVYPALDSEVWQAAGMPPLDRVLGFDPEAGLLAAVHRNGAPLHIDLRLGTATVAAPARDSLRSLSSANGSDIFGVDRQGAVVRLNPVGRWSFPPPVPAYSVYPQSDGAVIIAADDGRQALLWRVRPPDDRVLDSARLARLGDAAGTQLGDRLYFATDTAVVGLTTRTLDPVRGLRTRDRTIATAATPSGDRMYFAAENQNRIRVVDRFVEGRTSEIRLPATAGDLRMDPLGRYLLVRSAATDSAWVVAVGTEQVLSTVGTRWTTDLPVVAADGTIATLGQRDVMFVRPEDGVETARVRGGASDFWIFLYWNGFRPRAEGLDVPVTFPTEDVRPDSPAVSPPAEGDVARPPAAPVAATPGFTISFAALLASERAQALAESISVGGVRARVVSTPTGPSGVVLHRVVLGPYPTRDEAERAADATRRPYWIFEGAP